MPNGLCSSIMESKHIKAVKEPWRRSNKYNALGQMLVTNERLDKLAAARMDFTRHHMLSGSCLAAALTGQAGNGIPADNVIHGISNADFCDEGIIGLVLDAHVDLAQTMGECMLLNLYLAKELRSILLNSASIVTKNLPTGFSLSSPTILKQSALSRSCIILRACRQS